MRKILLATTAVTASVFALSANAAEAPKVSISGTIDFQYVDESSDTQGNAGTNQLQAADSNTAIIWDIDAEADNGLKYGGRVDWRTSSDSIDEIWIDMAGSFGSVVIGNDDGALDRLPSALDVLVGSYAYDGDFTGGAANQIGGAQTGFGSNFETGDSSKLTYFTPAFAGFTGGFSHTPDDNNGAGESVNELVAAYSGEFSGVGVEAGIGYIFGEAGRGNEDVAGVKLGALVEVAGFTIGAGYQDDDESGVAQGSSATAGEGYNVAVGYAFGDVALSLGYLATEADDATGTSDEYENLHLDVEYTIAEGLAAYAGVQLTESTDGSAGTTEEGTAFVIGTNISF